MEVQCEITTQEALNQEKCRLQQYIELHPGFQSREISKYQPIPFMIMAVTDSQKKFLEVILLSKKAPGFQMQFCSTQCLLQIIQRIHATELILLAEKIASI